MLVYIITNNINKKQYVGQTIQQNLCAYWKYSVQQALGKGSKKKPLLYNAIRKYGPEAFEIKSLVIVGTKEWLDYYEKGLIKAFKTRAPNGYNLTDGGEGSPNHPVSNESRQKMSVARKGKPFSETHKQNLSLSHQGLKQSAEQIQKRVIKMIGKPGGMLGKKHSEDAKRKISFAFTGEKHPLFGTHPTEKSKTLISNSLRKRLGKPPVNSSEILHLWKEGFSKNKISNLLDVSRTTIRRIIREHENTA